MSKRKRVSSVKVAKHTLRVTGLSLLGQPGGNGGHGKRRRGKAFGIRDNKTVGDGPVV